MLEDSRKIMGDPFSFPERGETRRLPWPIDYFVIGRYFKQRRVRFRPFDVFQRLDNFSSVRRRAFSKNPNHQLIGNPGFGGHCSLINRC
jgi:hypothetical protein